MSIFFFVLSKKAPPCEIFVNKQVNMGDVMGISKSKYRHAQGHIRLVVIAEI